MPQTIHNNRSALCVAHALGKATDHRRVENDGVLKSIADAIHAYIDADMLYLSVHEGEIDEASSACVVIGPWDIDQSRTFLDQSKWSAEDRVIAKQLAQQEQGRLYRRSDLIDEALFRNSRLYKEFHEPMNIGDASIAYRRSPQGPALVLAVGVTPTGTTLDEGVSERVNEVLPAVFATFDQAWKPVPQWARAMKPQAKRILQFVIDGLDDEQIAARTGLTYHSVRAHLKRLFREAQVRSRLHLMQAYLEGKNSETLDREVAELVAHRDANGTRVPAHSA